MTCLVESSPTISSNSNICRLCVQTDETLWNIFEACDEDTNLNLPEKILSCLNIMVEVNDGLPDQVCGKCMTVVRCFYEYRQDCIRHDKILRESLQSLCNFDVLKSSAVVIDVPEDSAEEFDNGAITAEPLDSISKFDEDGSILKKASIQDSLISPSDNRVILETVVDSVDDPIVLQLKEDWSEDEEPASATRAPSNELESPWRSTSFVFEGGGNLGDNSSDTHTNITKTEASDLFAGRITRKESGMWVCNLCNEEYKVVRTLKKHIARHYAAVSNQCADCQTSFNSVEELDNHKSLHRSSSLVVSHTCELCYKTFQLDHLLKKHIAFEHNTADRRVTAPKKFRVTCGKCVKVFYCSFEMENHNESCGESLDGEASEVDSSDGNFGTKQSCPKYKVRVWPCYLCNLIFDKVQQLTFHFQKEHEGHKPLKCDVLGCERLFQKQRQLSDHRARDHGPGFKCTICSRVFKERKKLKDHMKVHQGDKSLKCVSCRESFRTSRDLGKHKKRHLKPLKCDNCDKSFGTKYDLTRHRAQVHSLKKDYICDQCGKVFAHSDNLRQHKKNHTKTFKCKFCQEEISGTAQSFSIHEHHCGEGNLKTCKLCNSQYTRQSRLNQHMKEVHLKQ